MKKLLFLSLFSVLGLAIAVYIIVAQPNRQHAKMQPLPQWRPPFSNYIAGTGLIAARPRNLVIRPLESGVVSQTHVKVGEQVQKGQLLLKQDDSDLLVLLPKYKAGIEEAKAEITAKRHDLDYIAKLRRDKAGYASKKSFTQARDTLNLARAKLAMAKADLESLNMRIQRRTIRAPIAGRLLRFDIQAGDYLEASQSVPAKIVMGSATLQLRAEINQYDAWRLDHLAPAIAWLPDRPDKRITLRFDHVEPYIVPKALLTGSPTERTDTRVLNVIYNLNMPRGFPLYVGQQLDVFIEASR